VIRALGALLAAGLALGACGSISNAAAMENWVVQSGYLSSASVLIQDAKHSVTALAKPSESSVNLHTVCGVLLFDTESANASLPTPDRQADTLLSKAYTNLGAGANECYGAANSVGKRALALRSLTSGVAYLSEASARIASASTP